MDILLNIDFPEIRVNSIIQSKNHGAVMTIPRESGWGRNTLLPDTFNLGWKMAAVLKGQSDLKLLATYSIERRKVAQQLINADKEL